MKLVLAATIPALAIAGIPQSLEDREEPPRARCHVLAGVDAPSPVKGGEREAPRHAPCQLLA